VYTSYIAIYINLTTNTYLRILNLQGGFLVLRPSVDDYKNLINIVKTVEFYQGSGWNRSQIGWFWGGMTVQGVLPYYYNVLAAPNRTQKVDRCIYNTMADTPPCEKQTLQEIKSAHFTVCQKPWNCYSAFVNDLCHKLHTRWFELRKEAEEFYGMDVVENPCPAVGLKNYVRMSVDKASLAEDRIRKKGIVFKLDDSPDVLVPIGNTGFDPSIPYDVYKHY
jgi:hypothetical protein